MSVLEIVSSPQAKAYEGVKHSDPQKGSDLRGGAHLLPKPRYSSMAEHLHMEQEVDGSSPSISNRSKRLLLSRTENALIPDRKESGHLEVASGEVLVGKYRRYGV